VQWLSSQSYSVFVCHFAAIVLVSGVWVRLELQGLGPAVAAVAAAAALALGLGAAVQALCDQLLAQWRTV
jgi:peptidoglycan/LPS O-acetylase OafA/YrhL